MALHSLLLNGSAVILDTNNSLEVPHLERLKMRLRLPTLEDVLAFQALGYSNFCDIYVYIYIHMLISSISIYCMTYEMPVL